MARPRRNRRILTIVILVLASLTIITIDQTNRTHHFTSGLRSAASSVLSPLRSAVNDLLRPIGDSFAGMFHYGALQQENQKLQAQLGRLRLQQSEQAFKNRQLQELTTLAHLPYLGSLPTVTAQTLAINVSNFDSDIEINKGRDEGVAYGMPVVGAGGLVGQVIQANHHTSTVQLIDDGRSKVGVTFGNQQLGTVNGQGSGSPLSVEFVAPGTQLKKGEVLYTNGLAGGSFPAGIPVGYVSSFNVNTGSTQVAVAAEPMANLSRLAYVDVVQWEPTP